MWRRALLDCIERVEQRERERVLCGEELYLISILAFISSPHFTDRRSRDLSSDSSDDYRDQVRFIYVCFNISAESFPYIFVIIMVSFSSLMVIR